jgi:cell division protein FtsW
MRNIIKKINNFCKSTGNYFDFSLLFMIIFLLCFGLVMLYSTSSYSAQIKYDNASFYLVKQMTADAIGIAAMIAVMYIGYQRIRRFALYLYLISIVLVCLVLTPLGYSANGARRWLSVGFSIQPAEFVKLTVIVLLAYVISQNVRRLSDWRVIMKIALVAVPGILVVAVITENLSTAIIILGIAFVMLFVASPNYKPFVVMIIVAVVAVGVFLMVGDGFRLNRIEVWKDPEAYSDSGGYQVMQGLYAIGSGGFFGKGLGQSLQKMGFIPEAQNDMIFTIICEELGLFGAICVILMFLFMLWRMMVIANNAPDVFSSMIVVGVMAHVALQVILNIAVVTNTIPNTGVTLPFISYGGTSVVFLLMEMGLVLSIARSIKVK